MNVRLLSGVAVLVDGRRTAARAAWRLLQDGDPRGRLRATREGQAAIRLQLATAALDCGVLDLLAEHPAPTADLARAAGVPDAALLAAFLRVLAAAGLVEEDGTDDGRPWRLTRRGRAVVGDDLVRALYEAFGGLRALGQRGGGRVGLHPHALPPPCAAARGAR